mmetsp:Transcript_43446/g.81153  ORF Transcript_43446/g.81153 Transcript_43446/m.81153 type:complete len:277 (+) Transcript_43446:433-1263(+)
MKSMRASYHMIFSSRNVIVTTKRSTAYHVESRASGNHVRCSGSGATNAQAPMTKSTLNTAEPMIVPVPMSLSVIMAPIRDVKNSGAEPPAAMNVAPATSGESSRTSEITSSAGTKHSSQTIAIAINIYKRQIQCRMTPPLLRVSNVRFGFGSAFAFSFGSELPSRRPGSTRLSILRLRALTQFGNGTSSMWETHRSTKAASRKIWEPLLVSRLLARRNMRQRVCAESLSTFADTLGAWLCLTSSKSMSDVLVSPTLRAGLPAEAPLELAPPPVAWH